MRGADAMNDRACDAAARHCVNVRPPANSHLSV
jgi:hypothetical protein